MGAGITSENVAAKFGVSRETQDRFAARSHALAAAAAAAGKFREEIVPVATVLKDPKTGAFAHAELAPCWRRVFAALGCMELAALQMVPRACWVLLLHPCLPTSCPAPLPITPQARSAGW